MEPLLVLARLLHVTLGVFWAGTMIFNAVFLTPAMRDAGPDGASVAAGIMRRRFMDIMPVVALLTLLSGFWLYWRVSGGFMHAYVLSATGLAYGLGGVAAIIAFGVGVSVIRPAMLRAAALTRAVPAVAEERDRVMQAAQAMRMRAAAAGRTVAWLLGFAVVVMAIGRYI
ncbi:MAG: hypothetical protein L0271_25250 [Gemmatimonadetes bacterium]|nr:hypothetical protein [Gemmatimonadota bacterium]